MPVFQNILTKAENSFQGLQNFDVLIDTTDNEYFNISDFPEILIINDPIWLPSWIGADIGFSYSINDSIVLIWS